MMIHLSTVFIVYSFRLVTYPTPPRNHLKMSGRSGTKRRRISAVIVKDIPCLPFCYLFKLFPKFYKLLSVAITTGVSTAEIHQKRERSPTLKTVTC